MENFMAIEALNSGPTAEAPMPSSTPGWGSSTGMNNTPGLSKTASIGDKHPHASSSASDISTTDLPPIPKVQKINEEPDTIDSDSSDVVLEEVDPKIYTLITNQAIVRYKSKLVTECAYPEPEENDKFARQAWKSARDDLQLSSNYCITPVMIKKIQRTATSWRSNLKDAARAVVGPIFGHHGTKADNARLAQELLTDHTYIYLESEHAIPNGDRTSLYENPLILAMIIQQWFSGKHTLGVRRAEDFGTRMPLGTMAFACTLICWAISEWLMGEFVRSTFGENDYQKINKYHKERLTIIEESSADAEMLLSTPNLFDARRRLWMSNARKGTTTTTTRLQAAPTNWNTEEYDEPAAAPEDDEEDFLAEEVVHMPVKPKRKKDKGKGKGKGTGNAKAALDVAPPRPEPEVNVSAVPEKDVNATSNKEAESSPDINEEDEEEGSDEEDEDEDEDNSEEEDGDAVQDEDISKVAIT
ncbi:hypothetical protein K474DRAFT_1713364 [Panus rudis PR-1116 ss-1]|nr:hypothetical protein K474DRAFT_1713364 [Panus rudis PR-1116 ss-1]